MICKACGHRNASTVSKCGACGASLGANEVLAMFQAQAQVAKGVEVSILANPAGAPGTTPAPGTDPHAAPPPPANSGNADEFFADLSPAPAAGGNGHEEMAWARGQTSSGNSQSGMNAYAMEPEANFFSEIKEGDDPSFEAPVETLSPKNEGPPTHALYSPPINPLIEQFLAQRDDEKRLARLKNSHN